MKGLRFQSKKGKNSVFAGVVGAAGVALVLLLVWLGADPEAHEHFHHDAGHDEHHCVITDFATGEGYYLAPQIAVRPLAAVFEPIHFGVVEALREPVDYILLPICGPPSNGLSV